MKKRPLSDKSKNLDSYKLQLRKESLDIFKNKVQMGSVKIYKETMQEEKTITVPITREELVVEKKVLDDKKREHTDTIRIPITEECIKIIKRPVVLESVNIYNKKSQNIKEIEVTLKKEKLRIQTLGDAKIIDRQVDDH